MEPAKEEIHKDYKIKIIEGKMRYLIDGMEYRRRILEEEGRNKLRDKRKKKMY